jgi:hypothetical protein
MHGSILRHSLTERATPRKAEQNEFPANAALAMGNRSAVFPCEEPQLISPVIGAAKML